MSSDDKGDFAEFLEFIKDFYQGYLESCRSQDKEPLEYEVYVDTRFFGSWIDTKSLRDWCIDESQV